MKSRHASCILLLVGAMTALAGTPQFPLEIQSAMSDIIVEVEQSTNHTLCISRILKNTVPPRSPVEIEEFLVARGNTATHNATTFIYFLSVRNHDSISGEVSRIPDLSAKQVQEHLLHPAYKFAVSKQVPIISDTAFYRGPTLAARVSSGRDDMIEYPIEVFRTAILENANKPLEEIRQSGAGHPP